jgi:hypothetical protein
MFQTHQGLSWMHLRRQLFYFMRPILRPVYETGPPARKPGASYGLL